MRHNATKGVVMQLKEMCKEIRKAMGLSQKEFGLLIGSSQTEVSFIEGGFTPPNTAKIEKIQKLFNELKR